MGNANAKTRILMLIGPTAAGKSAVAIEASLRLGAEIISLDSMQVYRGMDIGTAKPAPAERARVPHHLIDIRDPWESFSTAEYVRLADEAVAETTARGRLSLFVGGTALYAKSVLVGIFDGPSADWEFREDFRREAGKVGAEALHKRLAELDPEAAARIHPNDLRRIERALEIHSKTGRPASALRTEWKAAQLRYDARLVGILRPREELKKRIDARVDAMIAAGWLDEVRRLVADPRGLSREASQALGYAELAGVVRGEVQLAAAVEEIKRRTRRFAKAQMTWFKTFPAVTWVDASDYGATAEIVDRVVDLSGDLDDKTRTGSTHGGLR